MGTLKIGSASNRAGVTINPSTVLFNGDNVKSIKNGLIEIWSNVKALVPTMTSNTTPYGEAKCSNYYEVKYDAYRVFGGNQNVDTEFSWITAGNVNSNQWVQYKFVSPAIVTKVKFRTSWSNQGIPKNIKIQASNDGSTFDTLYEVLNTKDTVKTDVEFEFNNDKAYFYWRFYIVDSYAGDYNRTGLASLQFFGSQLRALVPPMTSNTTPSGVASASSRNSSSFEAWKAFNGTNNANGDDCWIGANGATLPCWICYQFTAPTIVKSFSVANRNYSQQVAIKEFTLQGSNDNSQWVDIKSFVTPENLSGQGVTQLLDVSENNNAYLYYRLSIASHYGIYPAIGELQFYD